ncbi:hypothetical protein FA15DRAFT_754025 [Coprinopsis marcescibilis]|uniref:Uncharacterized protein n=1 Tax=Coprinopsis marcescibilis TaxID=230819 RepID=A0A5C3LH42_COPMA|nr:hypothetical protein FA15DRAFT_754025 [Coprinopsis marcescibilis]
MSSRSDYPQTVNNQYTGQYEWDIRGPYGPQESPVHKVILKINGVAQSHGVARRVNIAKKVAAYLYLHNKCGAAYDPTMRTLCEESDELERFYYDRND